LVLGGGALLFFPRIGCGSERKGGEGKKEGGREKGNDQLPFLLGLITEGKKGGKRGKSRGTKNLQLRRSKEGDKREEGKGERRKSKIQNGGLHHILLLLISPDVFFYRSAVGREKGGKEKDGREGKGEKWISRRECLSCFFETSQRNGREKKEERGKKRELK